MKLSNKTYDVLKWIALVFLPACQVLWLGLGKVWSFPYLVEIGTTIALIAAFIGTLLGVSGVQYQKTPEGAQTTVNTDADEMLEVVNDEDQNDDTKE